MENSPGDSGFSNSQGSGHSGTPGRSLCGTGPRYQGSISLQTYDGPGIDQFAHSVRTDPRSLFKGWLRNHQFEAGSGWRRSDGRDGDPFAEGIGEEIVLGKRQPLGTRELQLPSRTLGTRELLLSSPTIFILPTSGFEK